MCTHGIITGIKFYNLVMVYGLLQYDSYRTIIILYIKKYRYHHTALVYHHTALVVVVEMLISQY